MRFCFKLVPAPLLLWVALLPAADTYREATSVVRADPHSGRLIRSVVVAPKVVAGKTVAERVVSGRQAASPRQAGATGEVLLNEIIDRTAREHQLDPLLVHAVIKVESNYDQFAISPKGAEGMMQLIPSTARRFGASNSFNIEENIRAGVKYLRYLKDTFQDDRLALAAYNAGEGAVLRYSWIPPYPETQQYVYQVGKRYGEARRAAAGTASKPSPATEAKQMREEPAHRPVEVYVDAEGRLYLRTR
jgi:soluble lytic murein transglycosylase-like protein